MSSLDQRTDPQDPTVRLERVIRFWGVILWPSFLAACLLEFMVFAIVDPAELHWPGDLGEPSNRAIYTVAFFAFWLVNIACCRLVLWLSSRAQPHGLIKLSGTPED
jgi:hypothetical protein